MPVSKYRRIEDMPGDRWLMPGDPAIVQSIHNVWRLVTIGPIGIARGVHKYHSSEEAAAERERWEDERIRGLRQGAARERKGKPV